jgi:hypothetical protein
MSCIPGAPVIAISATNKQSAHPLTCFKRIPKNAERTDAARAMNHSPFRTRADMGVDGSSRINGRAVELLPKVSA